MPSVMVVDDQSEKRAALAAALIGEGFDAIAVSSAEARATARQAGARIAIVDLMLHGTNGFELARHLRSAAPELGVILTSEYHFSPMQLERVDCGAIAFVPRPFAVPELAQFLRSKLDVRASAC